MTSPSGMPKVKETQGTGCAFSSSIFSDQWSSSSSGAVPDSVSP